MKYIINSSSFFFYNSFSSSVKIYVTWTESESDDAVINNIYDILKIREKSVRDILECNQKHIISSVSYLEYFNNF